MKKRDEGYIFGLDIGTRSIVGTVGYRLGADRFVVVALESIEHTTRAVIDGQIHDISTVAKTIAEIKRRLEERIGEELYDVSIAAAGRVLKTKKVQAVYDFAVETKVTEEHIRSLDMLGVEQAYAEIREEEKDGEKQFFCVGFSAVRYYLNGYPMEMIDLHSANSIGVELIATFLPEEVVDGLYSAVEEAGLHVASLTLEPIAAINVAIPEKFRLLNIALVDIGAGTSDISVVKDGSIIAFGMIPLAGDEVTEAIARNYLVDFETAERVKRQCERRKSVSFRNIFGESIQVDREEIATVSADAIDDIAKSVAERIITLNGGNTVSAVFVVGGGGKHDGLTEKLAGYLELPENRVALRGSEVLTRVDFKERVRKDSTLVTPIGICMNYYEQQNNFIHVTVNEQQVKLYDNGKVTVLDACISSGFSQSNLFPIKGENLHYSINGEERIAKGKTGEVALIKKNGKEISLNEPVNENDVVTIRPSSKGETGSISLGEIPECREELTITLFGRKILCPKSIEVNGEPVADPLYELENRDRVQVFDYYTVEELLEFAEIEKSETVLLNGREVGMTAKVQSGDVITKKEKTEEKKPKAPAPVKHKPKPEVKAKPVKEKEEDRPARSFEEHMQKDPLLQPSKPLPEWMKGIPFDTDKLGADGRVIPGLADAIASAGEAAPGAASAGSAQMPVGPTHITVNGTAVTIPRKVKPIFVDIFDVYPFDMSKAGGTRLVTKLNGADKDFTEPLREGDKAELYWES